MGDALFAICMLVGLTLVAYQYGKQIGSRKGFGVGRDRARRRQRRK